ncbi:MAG: alpha/beta hydrolase [Crocinitomicaceae bacterium]|nr:alpha/beta hydrolase [Crocinitomicaceae bacterium]
MKIHQQKTAGIISYREKTIHFEYHPSEIRTENTTVLLGGVLQDMASWKNYIREFSKTNNVIVADLPGVGKSDVLDSRFDFEFLADCLNQVLSDLGISQVHIFSTSYSTILAFEFAKKYTSKVGRLVISSSMTEIPENQMNIMLDCLTAIEKNDVFAFSQLFLSGIANQHQKPLNSELVSRVSSAGIRNMTDIQMQQFKQNTLRVLNYNMEKNKNCKINITPLIFTGEIDNFTPPALCKK